MSAKNKTVKKYSDQNNKRGEIKINALKNPIFSEKKKACSFKPINDKNAILFNLYEHLNAERKTYEKNYKEKRQDVYCLRLNKKKLYLPNSKTNLNQSYYQGDYCRGVAKMLFNRIACRKYGERQSVKLFKYQYTKFKKKNFKYINNEPTHSNYVFRPHRQINNINAYYKNEPEQINHILKRDNFNQDLFDIMNKPTCLTEDQHELLTVFLRQNAIYFSDIPGKTEVIVHNIELTSEKPIARRPYHYPPKLKQVIKDQVQEMLDLTIIKKSTSNWASPVVLVKKKDDEYRFCVDYRGLNKITLDDKFPVPVIHEVLDGLGGAKIVSTLDLTAGFWQIKMNPKDTYKTAFITAEGLFEFNRMPFGLKNSGSSFCRLMSEVLRDVIGVCAYNYIDDVVIYSKTFEQHIIDLKTVFTLISEAGLKIKIKKCSFACENTKFLGHIWSPKGLEVNPEKTEAVGNFPRPINIKQVMSFLGLTGWYRSFVPNYADIAEPLNKLKSKKSKWEWGVEQENSFQNLKQALINPPILQAPDFALEFILQTDASLTGLGSVLRQQNNDGTGRVIAYASRKLKKYEKNYSITELELLGIIWSLKKFRGYLYGTSFQLETDHSALTWALNLKEASSRLTRWVLLLQEYNYKIKYRKGKDNTVPDVLSRAPIDSQNVDEQLNEFIDMTKLEVTNVNIQNKSINKINAVELAFVSNNFTSREQIISAQKIDKYCISIKQKLQMTGTNRDNKVLGPENKPKFTVVQSILYLINSKDEQYRVVVPEDSKIKLLEDFHDNKISGHMGFKKTYTKIKGRAYWPKMKKDIIDYCNTCEVCQRTKHTNKAPAGLMQSVECFEVNALTGIDFMGPFPVSSLKNEFLLVICDYHSKWVELFPSRKATAKVVAKYLIGEYICRYGVPRAIVSDNGRQFISKVYRELADEWGFDIRLISKYRAQSNFTERHNKNIGQLIRAYIQKDHRKWDQNLVFFRMALNSTESEGSGFTPAEIFLGRPIKLPFDRIIEPKIKDSSIKDMETNDQINSKLMNAKKITAGYAQKSNQARNKLYYDKKHRDLEFKVGDQVLVKAHKLSKANKYIMAKLCPKWEGPYTIYKKLGALTYEITDKRGKIRDKQHIANLKLYRIREELPVSKLHSYNFRKKKGLLGNK